MRSMLEQTFSLLPDRPLSPGDTWTGKLSMGNEMIGRITGTSSFTLKGVEGQGDAAIARIGVAIALKQEAAPPVGPTGMSMKMADSKGDGEVEFAVAQGRIRRTSVRSEMPSTMSMTLPDGTSANMQNLTKTTMTMELVDR